MRETTAEIWIGPDQSSQWVGTQGGINASHLMLLRENSRPAWMLMAGNLYDSRPPILGKSKVWNPTIENPIQDALLMFAVIGAKVPEIRAVFSEFEKSRSSNRVDLAAKFPESVPSEIYAANQRHLRGFHVIISVGNYSLASVNLDVLNLYPGLNIEVRTTR